MKNLICLLVLTACFSCHKKTVAEPEKKVPEQTYGSLREGVTFKNLAAYSDFDTVERYVIADESSFTDPKRDQATDATLFEDFPATLDDTAFFKILADKYTKKSNLSAGEMVNLQKLLSQDRYTDVHFTACVPEYRDILIFKKSAQTSGILKICLGCQYFYLIGLNHEGKPSNETGSLVNPNAKTDDEFLYTQEFEQLLRSKSK